MMSKTPTRSRPTSSGWQPRDDTHAKTAQVWCKLARDISKHSWIKPIKTLVREVLGLVALGALCGDRLSTFAR